MATAEQRERFIAAGARLVARRAETVVLGGIDLSLAFDGAIAREGITERGAAALSRISVRWKSAALVTSLR